MIYAYFTGLLSRFVYPPHDFTKLCYYHYYAHTLIIIVSRDKPYGISETMVITLLSDFRHYHSQSVYVLVLLSLSVSQPINSTGLVIDTVTVTKSFISVFLIIIITHYHILLFYVQ